MRIWHSCAMTKSSVSSATMVGLVSWCFLFLLTACDSDQRTAEIPEKPALKQAIGLVKQNPESDSNSGGMISLIDWLGATPQAGFLRADQPRQFHFPEDHGPHDGYQIEWWYLTGNLDAQDPDAHDKERSNTDSIRSMHNTQLNTAAVKRRFGYQVTLFRIALAPPVDSAANQENNTTQAKSRWKTRHIWMAHAALTDVTTQRHYQAQRLIREGVGLAGAEKPPLRLWAEDWQISSQNASSNPDSGGVIKPVQAASFPWQLSFKTADFTLQLSISPLKPVVLQGDNGLSRKSAEPGNASYYYSLTRLKTNGEIALEDHTYQVNGLSWLDREWSTSALGPGQSGWNWFSLQLDNGTDVMFYQLQRKDGSVDLFSAGKWINKKGKAESLNAEQVILEPLETWQSPSSKRYVTQWLMSIPEYKVKWRIKAAVEDQEMKTAVIYWEGAVDIIDADSDEMIGRGYLEMTGH